MARTNRSQAGVFEPEFRLVLLVISGPITTAGLIGTGIVLDQALPLAWVLVWMSVFSFGTLFNVQVILTYVVDCFPEKSGQAFSTVNLVSSIVNFVGSGVLITWHEMVGPMVVFGSLQCCFCVRRHLGGKHTTLRTWQEDESLHGWTSLVT